MRIKLKRLSEEVALPRYAREGDAGLDLTSQETITLKPHERALVPTGICIELPEGYAAYVIPRSGLAIKHGISIVNAPGLIDSNYRGEIKVVVINTDDSETYTLAKGDRIAQLMIIEAIPLEIEEVDELDITCRNDQGFGSSGV